MLILTRRIGESVVINNNIDIKILGIKGNQVKMGFNADKDISINREEIQDLINKENMEIGNDRI